VAATAGQHQTGDQVDARAGAGRLAGRPPVQRRARHHEQGLDGGGQGVVLPQAEAQPRQVAGVARQQRQVRAVHDQVEQPV
jgi:hypothetical protein